MAHRDQGQQGQQSDDLSRDSDMGSDRGNRQSGQDNSGNFSNNPDRGAGRNNQNR